MRTTSGTGIHLRLELLLQESDYVQRLVDAIFAWPLQAVLWDMSSKRITSLHEPFPGLQQTLSAR